MDDTTEAWQRRADPSSRPRTIHQALLPRGSRCEDQESLELCWLAAVVPEATHLRSAARSRRAVGHSQGFRR